MRRKRRNSDPKSLSDSLNQYLRALGIDQKLEETALLARWPDVVGEPVAKRTTGLKLVDGVLRVSMNSAVMRDVLLQSRSLIISRMNEIAGKIVVNEIYLE